MSYNLTDTQRVVLSWLVDKVNAGVLDENDFRIFWQGDQEWVGIIGVSREKLGEIPKGLNRQVISILARERMLEVTVGGTASSPIFMCALQQRAKDAVASNFADPLRKPEMGRLARFLGNGNYFSRGELETITFNLGFNIESIGGDTIEAYARKLVEFTNRHGDLWDLVHEAFEMR